MRIKFKYQECLNYDYDDLCGYEKTKNPLPYKNLPNGYYLIRGNKKEHRKKYLKQGNNWYLLDDVTKDNGQYYCDSNTYNLFPSLPEKEWLKIKNVGFKRLNKVWQRHLYGYLLWCDLRNLSKEIKLDWLKFEKDGRND